MNSIRHNNWDNDVIFDKVTCLLQSTEQHSSNIKVKHPHFSLSDGLSLDEGDLDARRRGGHVVCEPSASLLNGQSLYDFEVQIEAFQRA